MLIIQAQASIKVFLCLIKSCFSCVSRFRIICTLSGMSLSLMTCVLMTIFGQRNFYVLHKLFKQLKISNARSLKCFVSLLKCMNNLRTFSSKYIQSCLIKDQFSLLYSSSMGPAQLILWLTESVLFNDRNRISD